MTHSYNGPWERDEDLHPLIVPPIQTWELNENSTRYDYVIASPSDQDRILMWSLWSVLSFSSGIIIFLVFSGMLSNYRVRKNSFNQYLLFLMTPDLVCAMLCGITCTLNATHAEYVSTIQCTYKVGMAYLQLVVVHI